MSEEKVNGNVDYSLLTKEKQRFIKDNPDFLSHLNSVLPEQLFPRNVKLRKQKADTEIEKMKSKVKNEISDIKKQADKIKREAENIRSRMSNRQRLVYPQISSLQPNVKPNVKPEKIKSKVLLKQLVCPQCGSVDLGNRKNKRSWCFKCDVPLVTRKKADSYGGVKVREVKIGSFKKIGVPTVLNGIQNKFLKFKLKKSKNKNKKVNKY